MQWRTRLYLDSSGNSGLWYNGCRWLPNDERVSVAVSRRITERRLVSVPFCPAGAVLIGELRCLSFQYPTLLCVPRHNLERYGRRSFSCTGPVLWNSFPEDMRLTDSLNYFRAHHYFKRAYNLWLYTSLILHNITCTVYLFWNLRI